MVILAKKSTVLILALTLTSLFQSSVNADVMFGTGGYAIEFKKMEMMKMLDVDGNRMVSAAEHEAYYADLFEMLDKNKDGELSIREWVGIKGKSDVSIATGGYVRELRSTKMMDAMDVDGNHVVNKDEFINFHKNIFNAMDKSGDKELDPQEWLARQVG